MAAPAPAVPTPTLRILGIDPGLRITGFGIIDKTGSKLVYVTSGCVRSPDGELPERLKSILDGVREVVATHLPQQTAVALGQARGAAICALVDSGVPVAEYTALQVKQAVVGNGHAKKEQVQEMVKRLLALPGVPSPDAADALACAICHAHGGQGLGGLDTKGLKLHRGRLG